MRGGAQREHRLPPALELLRGPTRTGPGPVLLDRTSSVTLENTESRSERPNLNLG